MLEVLSHSHYHCVTHQLQHWFYLSLYTMMPLISYQSDRSDCKVQTVLFSFLFIWSKVGSPEISSYILLNFLFQEGQIIEILRKNSLIISPINKQYFYSVNIIQKSATATISEGE